MRSNTNPKSVRFCEKEWDKLLSGGQEETQNGQKYSNSTGQSRTSQPSSVATSSTHSNVQGDHMNLNHQPPIKLTEFEQMKLAAEEPPNDGKKSNIKRRILKVIVTSMFILMAVGVIVIWSLHDASGKDYSDLQFEIDGEFLTLVGKRLEEVTITGHLGGDIFMGRNTEKCPDRDKNKKGRCISWDDGNMVDITPFSIDDIVCYNVSWVNPVNVYPQDCYEMDTGHWYNMLPGPWPITAHRKMALSRFGHNEENGMDIVEYYFLSSEGTAIYLPGNGPYQFSWNESSSQKMCISPALNGMEERKNLNYFTCQGYDVKATHLAVSKRFHLEAQRNLSDQVKYTDNFLWSAEIKDSQDSYGDQLRTFKNFLDSSNFECNVLELESHWQEDLGDLKFDKSISPDFSSAMSLLSTSCDFMLNLSPLCSLNSPSFSIGIKNNYFLIDTLSLGAKVLTHSNTQVAVWDINNDEFSAWFSDAISNISTTYGVRNFKFSPLPQMFLVRHSNGSDLLDEAVYGKWIDLLNIVSEKLVTKGMFRSQDKHAFLEVSVDFVMNENNASCVTETLSEALTLGLYGYPYVLSSAKGNINLNNDTTDSFIRWLQLSVFFPAIKIPSDIQFFREDVITYAQNLSQFRQEFVVPILEQLRTQVTEVIPFLRPIWWLDPMDKDTFSIGDEFLLGDKVLVAPVLCSGVRKRNIYLPKGSWLDPMHGMEYPGGEWLTDFPVNQFHIPYFVLQENNESE
ncbi:myogenesis-regulating glycosidase-like [Ylistrum balloti]|uniref:myogenesis-regulating glycosidase-like n=1 Tax=Ylistrum balloti TaxID=509963 RepID=UPI002905DB8F|nr:myogenesis-regulating glycosidase-like [Ylistrum balloti]